MLSHTGAAPRSATSSHRFRTMDGMRGIAAMIVVLGHAPEFFGLGFMPHFWLSVDLFFLMSGFVLGRTYEPRFAEGMGPREFMILRYIRLYPLYGLGILIGIISGGATLALGKGDLTTAGFVAAAVSGLLLLPALGTGQRELFPLNFPAWSLFLEILANLVFALAWRRLSDRVLLGLVVVLGTLLFIYASGGTVFNGTTWPTVHWGMTRIGFSFFLGVLLQRHHPGARWHSDAAYLVPVAMAVMICLPITVGGGLVDAIQVIVLFPLLLWLSGLVEPRHHSVMTALGVSSYPIYVLHEPILSVAWRGLLFLHRRPEPFAPWLGVALLAGLFLAGLLLDRHYDGPVRRWLTTRFGPHARRDRRLVQLDTPL